MTAVNSLPRWLISITPQPAPCQSSSSSLTCSSTSAGKTAGPAAKFQTRDMAALRLRFFCVVVRFDDLFQTRQLFTAVERDQRHALSRTTEFANL